MATTVASPATRRSGLRLTFKIVLAFVLVVALAMTAAFAWFYRTAHASLAQLDGTLALSGLATPVSVVRDAHGVPHLTAASLEDLFFAQGYVTAQDRLWQMDMTRRAAGGELSEILGTAPLPGPRTPSRSNAAPAPHLTFVDYDKTQRILRLRAVADRVAEQLPERDRMIFTAYARGVNAYIDQHRDNLPIEFRLMRYQPREWTATDSVLVGIAMSQLLNPQYDTEYRREKISQLLTPELMADLYPVSSPRDQPPGADNVTTPAKPPAAKTGAITSLRVAGALGSSSLLSSDCEACVPGSNNWVVSGADTTSGKP